MAYTIVPTTTTGDVATAAWANTHIKDNFAATAVGLVTTAGDQVYASAANVLARLAIGTTGHLMRSTGTLPEWSDPSGILPVDAAAGTGSLRTLGTGALQAAAGNHTHTLSEDQTADGNASQTNQSGGNYTGTFSDSTAAKAATASLTTVAAASRVVGWGAYYDRVNAVAFTLDIGGVEVASGSSGSHGINDLKGSRTGISGTITVVFEVANDNTIVGSGLSAQPEIIARGMEVGL